MPHPKEHPLAGRRVVPDAQTGATLYVVDWLDRLPNAGYLLRAGNPVGDAFRRRIAGLDLHVSGAVLAHAAPGVALVHHAELPAYDPVPVGVIS